MSACYLHIDRALHSKKNITIGQFLLTSADFCVSLNAAQCIFVVCEKYLLQIQMQHNVTPLKVHNWAKSVATTTMTTETTTTTTSTIMAIPKRRFNLAQNTCGPDKIVKENLKRAHKNRERTNQSSKLQTRQKCTFGCCYLPCNEKQLMDVRIHECLLSSLLILYVVQAIGSVDLIENCSYESDFLRNSLWVGLRRTKPFAFNSGLSLAN